MNEEREVRGGNEREKFGGPGRINGREKKSRRERECI
jgi:hypothetical protein